MSRTALAALLVLFLYPRASAALAEPELILDFARPRRERAATTRRAAPVPAPEQALPPAPPPPSPLETERPRLAPDRPERRKFLSLRSRLWLAKSNITTRYGVQFPSYLVSGVTDNVFYGETEERAASGTMIVYAAEVAPLSWLSFEAEYGSDRANGTYTDHYWVHAPGVDLLTNLSNGATFRNPEHEDDLRHEAKHRARREWLSASVYFRVLEGRLVNADEANVRHSFDAVIGAHRFRQESSFTDLNTTLSGGKFFTPVPLGPVAGFDGHYTGQWRAVHFGFREEIRMPLGFAFDGLALWAPVAEFRGDGFQNASSLRRVAPNIVDRAHGMGLHFRLGAAWNWNVVRVEAGYMRVSFRGYRGSRKYLNTDGSTTEYHLEHTRALLDGLYFGGALRF